MHTIRRNSTNAITLPLGDYNIATGNTPVLCFVSADGGMYFVKASEQSTTRSDFVALEFTETLIAPSPVDGSVSLPLEGECTLTIYRSTWYTTDISLMNKVATERIKICH